MFILLLVAALLAAGPNETVAQLLAAAVEKPLVSPRTGHQLEQAIHDALRTLGKAGGEGDRTGCPRLPRAHTTSWPPTRRLPRLRGNSFRRSFASGWRPLPSRSPSTQRRSSGRTRIGRPRLIRLREVVCSLNGAECGRFSRAPVCPVLEMPGGGMPGPGTAGRRRNAWRTPAVPAAPTAGQRRRASRPGRIDPNHDRT